MSDISEVCYVGLHDVCATDGCDCECHGGSPAVKNDDPFPPVLVGALSVEED